MSKLKLYPRFHGMCKTVGYEVVLQKRVRVFDHGIKTRGWEAPKDSLLPRVLVMKLQGLVVQKLISLGTGHYLWPGLWPKRNYFDSIFFYPTHVNP